MAERIRAWGCRRNLRRELPRLGLVGFALLYVLVIADPTCRRSGGNWRTTSFGSAIDDRHDFVITLLNGLTFAGCYFIVASGFSLIFGLMRVVNMAHGAFYLLGGYIAYEVQQRDDAARDSASVPSSQVNTWEWVVPRCSSALA